MLVATVTGRVSQILDSHVKMSSFRKRETHIHTQMLTSTAQEVVVVVSNLYQRDACASSLGGNRGWLSLHCYLPEGLQ